MDIADDVHHFGHVGFGAAFVDNRQVGVQHLGHGTSTHHTADVGADYSEVFDALLKDIVHQNRGGIDVVHRNIEKALDLVGMQIHGQHAVNAGGGEHIGHQLGGNRHAHGTRAAVLAGIAEIGDGCGDAAGGSAFERVGHGEQLHQIIVGGGAGGLQDKHVAAAHVFQKLHGDFAVGKFAYGGAPQGNAKVFDHVLSQADTGVAGEYH